MGKLVCITNEGQKNNVLWFVKGFRKKSFFRRAKVYRTLDRDEAYDFRDMSDADVSAVFDLIHKIYPGSECWAYSNDTFPQHFVSNRFWVICCYNGKNDELFYSGDASDGKAEYTTDINDARIIMAESSANETLNTIRTTTRDRVWVQQVYLTLTNELLKPCFMIVCESKGNGDTRYFTKLDGHRVRGCATSDAAAKFNYEDVLKKFSFLTANNKNYMFAVVPRFDDNVNIKDIQSYMQEKKISRMIVLDLKLRFLNR